VPLLLRKLKISQKEIIVRMIFGGFILVFAIVGMIFFFRKHKHIPFDQGSPYDMATGGHGRKKILIFSSKGGGGHISVTNALFEYLGDEYTLGSTYIFSEVLGRFDPIRQITRGYAGGEDLYNYMIKKKWNTLLSLNHPIGSWLYNINRRKIEAVLEEYLTTHKPDLVISVIPIINNLILNVTKKLDIPFLLIPTDLDPTIALNNICKPDYEKFHLALSYNDEEINKKVSQYAISQEQISYVGFPVKKAFLQPHSERKIKRDFHIPEDKPVILLLMGAQGTHELYDYTKRLTKLTVPAHILIAIGRSENLRKSLNKIQFPSHISRDIIGFTNRIPDLMGASDLIISKAGSVSVNEAIYSNLPIILDGTSSVISWEYFNLKFIKKHEFGSTINYYTEVADTINDLLENKKQLKEYKQHLEKFHKPNTQEEIKILIKKILK
jgi:processive 1,2-diacylglycerol beta-glucosyltransferase